MIRYLLAAVPLVLGGLVVVGLTAIWLLGIPLRIGGAPEQPVAFPHTVHVQAVGLDCVFCHRGAETGPSAIVPAVEQCMFCHSVITGQGRAATEIGKVRQAWAERRSIDWARVHVMPDHVRFTHEPHIQAGLDCATCHGDVANMREVTQVRSLRMGDCVACHRENNAPTDCVKCHY